MPTFHNPVRVDVIESGSGFPWELLGGLTAAVAVVLFVLAHLVVIAVGLAVAAVVTVAAVRFLRRFMVVGWAPRTQRATLQASVAARAVSEPQRPAIETAAQHLHLHLHGWSVDDLAAFTARRDVPARPAIKEKP